jgi:hypothetical protein
VIYTEDNNPFDDPRWELWWVDDDAAEWEPTGGLDRCRGRPPGRWGLLMFCESTVTTDAPDGLCEECRRRSGRCVYCVVNPAAYSSGACRTCYRWLARNRDKYPAGELEAELAKRVARRRARLNHNPSRRRQR